MAGINRTTDKATDLITFSRASGGTALRKISYGAELVTNGTFDSDTSGWTANRSTLSVSSNALRITEDGTNDRGYAYQVIPTEINKVYQVEWDVVDVNSSWTALWVGTTHNNASAYQSSNFTTAGRKTAIFVATADNLILSFPSQVTVGGTTEYTTIDNISVKEVLFDQFDGTLTLFNHPTNIPRIEYDADGNLKGLLIEEARTNLITYSEAFDNAYWAEIGVSVSANVITSPDGSSSGDKLTENTSTGRHDNYAACAVSSGVAYTCSVYAKANGRSWIRLRFDISGSFKGAYFNLSNGSIGTIDTGYSAVIEDVGGGWYRCSVTTTTSGTSYFVGVRLANADGSDEYTGDGTSGIYVWGAQVETGSFPTSYIPTSGATATRAADIASISVDNFGYNQKEGTVVVEASKIGPATNSYTTLLIFRDTASGISNRAPDIGLGSGRGGTVGVTRIDVYEGGALQASLGDTSSFEVNTFYKAGAGLKKDNFASVLDGAITTTDTSGSVPSANKLDIGNRNFSNVLNGHIKSIQYYPRRLSNAQLQELTS